MHNSTFNVPGRLGNILVLNILCSRLSRKYNLKFNYKYLEPSNMLGLSIYTEGTCEFENTITFEEDHFEHFIENEQLNSNVYINKWHQTPSNSHQIKKYILTPEIRESIINHNKFKDRYDNNNDVYVHVRLDDVTDFNPGYDYYDSVLKNLTFDKGYISSDTITHPTCCKLIEKYNLQIVNFEEENNIPLQNEVLTIMFGSTCKHIVLSAGTFSFMIGVMSFVSSSLTNVYYHNSNHNSGWGGYIYEFDEWNCVSTDKV